MSQQPQVANYNVNTTGVRPSEGTNARTVVDYSTLSIKVPTNRIGSVFGFMKQLYKNEKRLSRESYRKNVKVLHTSEIKSVSETTDTTVEEIRTMIRNELNKTEGDYSVKVEIPNNKISAPKAQPVIKKPVKERVKKFVQKYDFQSELCECKKFVDQLNFDAKKYKVDLNDEAAKYKLIRGMLISGRITTHPCNRRIRKCMKTGQRQEIESTSECEVIRQRKEETAKAIAAEQKRRTDILEAQLHQMYKEEADKEARAEKDREIEEKAKEVRNRQYCRANMRKVIPNNDDLTIDLKALQSLESNFDEYYKLKLWRANNVFYGAIEFNELYCGWDFTRKTKWKLTHN